MNSAVNESTIEINRDYGGTVKGRDTDRITVDRDGCIPSKSALMRVGPYMLIERIGRGEFGEVWLAEKHGAIVTTRVAIKLLNTETVDMKAIRAEAAIWVHASGHANVLPIIDADIYDRRIVIASEYAPDGALSVWLKKHGGRAPSIASAVEMVSGILRGLEHLHQRGIIHRDLKPDNILLQAGIPRLADFGIARIIKSTSHTAPAGTPCYMAPEAFEGINIKQTDIWAVGVILYQLITGKLPFSQQTLPSLFGAILIKEPKPLPIDLPVPLRQIVKRVSGWPSRALRNAASTT